jgi:hypothetical protein
VGRGGAGAFGGRAGAGVAGLRPAQTSIPSVATKG